MTLLHFFHSGAVDERTAVDSFCGVALFDFFVMLYMNSLFFFSDNFGFLFFKIFEPKDEGFEGFLLGLLEDKILDGGI